MAPKGVAGREIPCGQRTDRRWKRHKGTEHVRKASDLEISLQMVTQDQRVAWPKLHCLKPSLLALSVGVCAGWLKRTQRRCTGAYPFGICTLSPPLGGEDAP